MTPHADPLFWRDVWGRKAAGVPAEAAGRAFYGRSHQILLAEQTYTRLRPGVYGIGSLLDIGCATGFLGEELLKACEVYVGVDYVPEMVASFKRRAGADVCCADAAHLPFRSGFFERTLLSGVLPCLTPKDTVLALLEMRRVTKTGGRGLIACALVSDSLVVNEFSTTWIRGELETVVRACGWSGLRWEKIHQSLHPSPYHEDLLVEAA